MIISFSGLDGAGKTTQIKMLLDTYKNMGARVGSIYSFLPDIRYHSEKELHMLLKKLCIFDVIHIRYRLNSDRNCTIMQHLENKMPPQRILATAAAIQGYWDHKELNKIVLEPLLAENKILIFDRYYYDELAFKYIYGCPDFLLNSIYKRGLDADLGFLIRITSEECIKRNLFRPDSKVALYQTHTSIKSLKDRFDNIAKTKNLITLNGLQPKEIIARSVLDYISYL